jgi:hypothetical protein
LIPSLICVFVRAPLIPEVALVELPPRNAFLSKTTTRPPCSTTVCAAERPARPPPTIITCTIVERPTNKMSTKTPKELTFDVPDPITTTLRQANACGVRHLPFQAHVKVTLPKFWLQFRKFNFYECLPFLCVSLSPLPIFILNVAS